MTKFQGGSCRINDGVVCWISMRYGIRCVGALLCGEFLMCLLIWVSFHLTFSIFLPLFTEIAPSTALNVDIKVSVGEGEPIESALRRFKREVNKSGHLQTLRHKRYFENSQERKKRKIVQARFIKRLERMQAKRMRQQRT